MKGKGGEVRIVMVQIFIFKITWGGGSLYNECTVYELINIPCTVSEPCTREMSLQYINS